MNIYQKLSDARVELQNMKLKKSGKNTFSNFTYYELADILPAINVICAKNGMMTNFYTTSADGVEKAVLDVYNVSEPQEIVRFQSPTANPEVGKKKDGTGGADPIQNLGAKITYMRRYLLMMAFEIVESEMVDAINASLIDKLEDEDIKKIEETKTVEELTGLCATLKQSYPVALLTPYYNKRKEELLDNNIKVEK